LALAMPLELRGIYGNRIKISDFQFIGFQVIKNEAPSIFSVMTLNFNSVVNIEPI
jgi:hypothetical protein